jgi:hypothetical protein
MLSPEIHATGKQNMTQLHAVTCRMMVCFINGHHYPKLAKMIVQQLQTLILYPVVDDTFSKRDMYLQLLEHWQSVTNSLLEETSLPSHLYPNKNASDRFHDHPKTTSH